MSGSQTLDHPYGARAPMLMGVTWTMAGIAIILTVLRTYTNFAIIRHFCWDYYWAMLALVTGLVSESFHTVATASGLGNHFDLLNHQHQVAALKWSYLGHIPVVNGIGFGKLAVVAFLLRIQDRGHPKKNWFLYFMGVSGCVVNMIITILLLLQCEPLERQWNDQVPGSCPHVLRTTNAGYVAGSWAAASDVLLALYPIIVYRKLQISRKDKIALFALLGGGVLAGASSVIKTIYIKLFDKATDKTYTITDLVLWELVECWLVLIFGSLPPLRAFYLHLSRQRQRQRQKDSSSSSIPSSAIHHFRRPPRCNLHPSRKRFSMNRESALIYSYQDSIHGGAKMISNSNDKKSPGHSHGNSDGSEDLVDGMVGGGVGRGSGIVKTTNIRISLSREEREGDDADVGQFRGGMLEV